MTESPEWYSNPHTLRLSGSTRLDSSPGNVEVLLLAVDPDNAARPVVEGREKLGAAAGKRRKQHPTRWQQVPDRLESGSW